MADIDITINSPILSGSEKFKVRYRKLPGGAYSAYQNETNAQFTISGLAVGNYEVEIIFVREDGFECDAVYRYFTINDYTCISFTAEIVQDANGLFWLEINYTPPASDPSCGWEIEYIQGSSTITIPYSTLPSGGQIRISVPNQSTILYVKAMLCGDDYKTCFVGDIQAVVTPPCIPASGVTFTFREVFNTNTGRCDYYLDVSFTQSNPATNPIQLVYAQQGGLVSDYFSGFILVSTGATASFTKKLNPVFLEGQECTEYAISLIDRCGNGWVEKKTFCRSICLHPTP